MPTCGSEPRTPPAPTALGIEFVSSSSGELDLDDNHDDAPLRFCAVDNEIGAASPPGLTDWELAEEMLVAIRDEPATVEAVKQSKE